MAKPKRPKAIKPPPPEPYRWDDRGFLVRTEGGKYTPGGTGGRRFHAIPDHTAACRHAGQDHNSTCAWCGAQIERTWRPQVPAIRPGLHDPTDQPRRAA